MDHPGKCKKLSIEWSREALGLVLEASKGSDTGDNILERSLFNRRKVSSEQEVAIG
jgi:hypothetical protein